MKTVLAIGIVCVNGWFWQSRSHYKYRKQQILRNTKLSRFTGFQQNAGKTVAVLLNYNTYLIEPLKLVEKTFALYRKSAKTAKVLYRGGFVVYGKSFDMFLVVICPLYSLISSPLTHLHVVMMMGDLYERLTTSYKTF